MTDDRYDAERFKRDTAKHEMTILHDDGLYRHVRFSQPGTSFYRYDLITWPWNLVITGDVDPGYVFHRIDDMFAFFRGSGPINPSYWQQKVRSGRDGIKTYSEDRFRQLVAEHIDDDTEEQFPGLHKAVQEKILGPGADWDVSYEDGAREALRDFTFLAESGPRAADLTFARRRWEQTSADRTVTAKQLEQARQAHDTARSRAQFEFTDWFEWDLCDWGWSFLWCCHAIQHGIRQYDAAKVPQVSAGVAS